MKLGIYNQEIKSVWFDDTVNRYRRLNPGDIIELPDNYDFDFAGAIFSEVYPAEYIDIEGREAEITKYLSMKNKKPALKSLAKRFAGLSQAGLDYYWERVK